MSLRPAQIELQREKRAEARAFAIAYLGGACVRCGTKQRLQFDHIDPSTKVTEVTRLFSSARSKLTAELEKCQLLCFTCHHDKTLVQLGQRKATEQHGTLTSYTHGRCRCDQCREFWNQKTIEYKKHAAVAQSVRALA